MSLIDFDGFETWAEGQQAGRYDAAQFAPTAATIEAGQGRNGGRCLLQSATSGGNSGNCWLHRSGLSFSEFVVGFAVRINSNQSGNVELFCTVEGSTRHFELFASTGSLAYDLIIARAGTALATLPDALTNGVYHYIEARAAIDDSAHVIVKIDGVVVYDDNVDTQNGGTGVCTGYYIGNPHGNNTNHTVRLDDFYLLAVDSEAPNDFIGDCKVVALRPSGAGSSTDFTPSAGANYQNVDDETPDGDSTYNEADQAGDTDLFEVGNLPSSVTVFGLKELLYARKSDAGSRQMRSVIKVGSSEFTSDPYALPDSYQWFWQLRAENPDTEAPWEESDVNGLEYGYTVES